MAWWAWVLIGWLVLSLVVALPLGLSIREADRRERLGTVHGPELLPEVRPVAAAPRRRIPAPPVAVVLAGVAVGLELIGFVLRATDADRTGTARLLSMDAPLSVPRMYVTLLFALAALVAFAGALRGPVPRRGWWLSVGLLAAVIAEIKGGGTVHSDAVQALGLGAHPLLTMLVSGVLLALVVGGLWWISRNERRDRRRVLTAVALYGFAAGGLSSVSSLVAGYAGDSVWTAFAVFCEEGGEALGAVAVLMAVLVGVAPRLVLPLDWALRRSADAETVAATGPVGPPPHPHLLG